MFIDPKKVGEDATLNSGQSAVKDESGPQTASRLWAGTKGSGSGEAASAAPARTNAVLSPGTLIGGRYEILELLGVGGMGAVYKAQDRDIDRIIAVKVILHDLVSDTESVQRFTQELLLARQIAHKNVVRIFDLRESGGLKFITMEYIDGLDLGSLLKQRGKVSTAEALDIVQQVCSGLAAAHEEGVLHRDLKPGNIMRDHNGRVVVMDFGLARKIKDVGLTHTGAVLGTWKYMSPEQALGESLDARSDLFSVGLVLFELLTGHTPYEGESEIANLLVRTKERPKFPHELNPEVSNALSAIVLKCLEPDREQRYASVKELSEVLDRVAGKTSPLAGLNLKFFGRKQFIASAIVTILVAAGIGLRIWRSHVSRPVTVHAPVTILVSDFQNNTSDAVFDGTLEPAFSLAMEGASFISTYSFTAAHELAAKLRPGNTRIDIALAKLIAMREGINTVIGGSIRRQGDLYEVSCQAQDALTGNMITKFAVTAQRNKVLVAMSKLAANVRRALGDATPVSAQIAAAETFTTSSLEAAHEYGLGQDALWAGKYESAIQHYQQSLKFDPKLGRAYSGLAIVAAILGHHQEQLDYYKQALANLDRMSEREKLRTLSGYYTVTRDTDKAIEELNTLIEHYPADTSGHANLALAYFYTRNMKMAMEEGERAVQISPKNVLQRNNVGLYAMYAGDFERAIREQRSVLELNPSLAKAHVGIALSQAGMNRLEDARKTYRQMEDVDFAAHSVAVSGLADLSLYEGDAAGAKALLEPEITADLSRKDVDAAATKRLMLAEAESSLHHNSQALDEAKEALKESTDSRTVFLAARVLLTGNAKDQSKSAELSNELAARPDNDSHAYSKLILGELRLRRDEAQESLRIFKEALQDSNAWLVRFDLGQAYVKLSEFPEADSELELCLQRRGEITAAFLDEVPTMRLLPEAYYYLGRAQEGINSPAAAETYHTFLSMKSKTVHDPLVDHAREYSEK